MTATRATRLLLATSATIFALCLARPAGADRASAHYHAAMAHKKTGNPDAAIKELKLAIGERDDYAAAHFSIGILYRQQKKLGKAISHLERAAKIDGSNGQIQYSLGLAYHKAGRADDALAALTRAAQLSPKDDQILAQAGVLWIRKDTNKAIEFLRKAVNLKPRNADHQHQLGLAYRKATMTLTGAANDARRKQFLLEAEKWLVKAASTKEDAGLEFDLGVLYRRLEKTDKAIQHYENAVRLNPKMAAAFWDLGHMYVQAKRQDDAIAAYNNYMQVGGRDRSIAQKRIKELRGKR